MRKVAISVDLETAERLTPSEENRLVVKITRTTAAVLSADVGAVISIKSGESQKPSLFFKLFSS